MFSVEGVASSRRVESGQCIFQGTTCIKHGNFVHRLALVFFVAHFS